TGHDHANRKHSCSDLDAYNLTILRADVALFLILVLTGFILLGIYVLQRRKLSWLCGSGSIAVFSLFYAVL
ncbi:MAG TPA: hypothetical protein VFO40_01240, partial [Chthoniobacterales bacterium]|nr:hypothetical protein [Chthoniobacterales bacterium]